MSIFGNIASAIFGHKSAAGTTSAVQPGTPAAKGTPTAGATPATGKAMTQAEVEAMIKKIADGQSEKLDWQHSIVDLMKLLKLDSSLGARKQLAQELGYKGSLDGSAEMNAMALKSDGSDEVRAKAAHANGKMKLKVYEKELHKLQVELCRSQD